MDLDKAIKARHSTRKFQTTKHADWRKVVKAIDAARLTPLAGNLPTIWFLMVIDKKKISDLAEAAQQPFIADADYIVVFCSDTKQQTISYDERGKKYSSQQAGAAIENFLLKITDVGLASCWVGAFADDVVRKILSIPEDIEIEALCPVGYEQGKSKQKPKFDLDKLIFFDKWKNRYMKPLRKPGAV